MRSTRRHFLATGAGVAAALPSLLLVDGVSVAASFPQPEHSFAGDLSGERIAAGPAWPYRPYQSRAMPTPDTSAWAQIDLGSSQPIEAVRLYPSNKYFRAGNGFPLRFRVECSDDSEFRSSKVIADRSRADYPDPVDQILKFPSANTSGRYIRLTVLRLRQKKQLEIPGLPEELAQELARESAKTAPVFVFSLAKIEVLSGGHDIALHRRVAVDSLTGIDEDAQQLTRAVRPQGEGVITDNPQNITPTDSWIPPASLVQAPRGGVRLHGGLFTVAMENNIAYLLESFAVDDLLRQFRTRAGRAVPETPRKPHWFWEDLLAGSNAGRFLMGAGTSVRWLDNPTVRARIDAVVAGIAECRRADGYIMAYPEETIFLHERGAYTRSWVTLGLLEAGYAGNHQAFELLRGYYDWYNKSNYLPQLLRRCMQGGQGMVANTRLYLTPVGRPADLEVIQRYFQENYWLDDLAKRKPEAIWQYPYDHPHVYLLTHLEAYLDLYRATGDARYLAAVDGGWELFRQNWQNVGGSFSIIEGEGNEPHSNKLYSRLGETCGSAFWILLNQRLHMLRPDDERYIAEIEKSLYNVILANQDGSRGIRYHTNLVGQKERGSRVNTCCEGQGTRILGSLPEYIYSLGADGVYVNLYQPSVLEWTSFGKLLRIEMRTAFPRTADVELEIGTDTPQAFKLRIRVPSWATDVMRVLYNGAPAALGKPGTYVTLEHTWRRGDKISFTLPIGPKLTKYTGTDQISGRQRFWLEYGPFLMAAIGASESTLLLMAVDDPTDLLKRLQPEKDNACHFVLAGSGSEVSQELRFIPYFEVAEQPFSCCPIIEARPDIL